MVLVASCGIWHSFDETATGSVLEVVLPKDISSASVNTFLEFLYEGHMILSEDNVGEIEKIARLLNVDIVLNCCHDFRKTIKSDEKLKEFDFRFQDLRTVNHIRSTTLVKTVSEGASSGTSSDKRQISETSDSSNDRRSSDIPPRIHEGRSQHSESLSYSSSTPSDLHRQRLKFQKQNQNHINTEVHENSSQIKSSHSIVDLTNEASIHNKSPRLSNDSVPYQRQFCDSSRIKSPRSSIESVSYQRQDSHQNETISNEDFQVMSISPPRQHLPSNIVSNGSMQLSEMYKRQQSGMSRPRSTDSYPSGGRNLIEMAQNANYSRSVSDEGLDNSQNKNKSTESLGFPLPSISAGLWDKTLMQYNASQEYFKAYYDGAFGALYAKANEPRADESTMDMSHSSDQQGSEDGR